MSFIERVFNFLLPKNYFHWHDFVLMSQGLIIPQGKFLKILFLVWCIPHTLFITIYLVTVELISSYQFYYIDIKEAMFTWAFFCIHLLSSVRIYVWHIYLKNRINVVVDLLQTDMDFRIFNLRDDSFKLDQGFDLEVPYEKLQKIWQRNNLWKSEKYNKKNDIDDFKEKQEFYARFKCLFLQFFFIFTSVNVFCIAYLNSQPSYIAFNELKNKTSTYKAYPFQTYFPFDTSVSDGYYTLGSIYQFYMFFFNVFSFIVLDTNGLNYLILFNARLTVVKYAITKIDKNIAIMDQKTTSMIKEMRIVRCIEETVLIRKGIDLIEQFYSKQLLFQYVICLLVLCTMMYGLQLVNSFAQLVYATGITILVLVEPFLISLVSQILTEEFYTLLPEIYELNWLGYSPEVRRKLIFMMMVMKKPKILTLGGMIVISVGFYTNLLRNSYSAYTLISQTQAKQHLTL